MEYLQVVAENAQSIVCILSLVAILLVIKQLQMSRCADFRELWMRAEKDFDEINKLMLDDKDLRDTYRRDDPALQSVKDEELKKFVYYEIYYGHLHRVYLMINSKINPFRREKDSEISWCNFRPMLKYLLGDPVFRKVHASAREMSTFRQTFVDEVDAVMRELQIQEPAGSEPPGSGSIGVR